MKQQRRCEYRALSVVVVFYLLKRELVLRSRDAIATIYIEKVVRGSGQMRGLLGLAESKSTAGWGAGGMGARSKNARFMAGLFICSKSVFCKLFICLFGLSIVQ